MTKLLQCRSLKGVAFVRSRDAVTMISTSIPALKSGSAGKQARTGGLLGSTHSFQASLCAAKFFMSVNQT